MKDLLFFTFFHYFYCNQLFVLTYEQTSVHLFEQIQIPKSVHELVRSRYVVNDYPLIGDQAGRRCSCYY